MYRSKREVLSSIKEITSKRGGKYYTIFSAFLGRDPITKKVKRIARSDRNELREYITDFYARLEEGGDSAVLLSHAQAVDAKEAYDLLDRHAMRMTLADAVRAFIAQSAAAVKADCRITVGQAWAKYEESIASRSDAYRKCVRSRVGKWVAAFGTERKLTELSAAQLKTYLMDNVYRQADPGTAKTYNNVLGDIKTFVHWCCSKEQAFLAVDPLDGMKKMEIGYRQPEYVKAADAARLFRALEAHKEESPADLADAILSFFCGMRTIEIERVREGDDAVKISLEDHFIRVVKVKGSLRGVRPRAFRIPEQAEAWMRSFDFLAAVHQPNPSFREHLLARAKEAGVKLPKNAGRHTFITMYEAVHHDERALSGIVGNTEGVRSRSYNGVELASEGKAYFAIAPTSGGSLGQ